MLNIDEFKIYLINDLLGVKRDPDIVYPNVSDSDWENYKSFAQNEDGTIQSTWRGYLLETLNEKILIDTGMGPGPYEHTKEGGQLINNLNNLSVSPEDINYVYITHTHGDHIGWNINWDSGKPVLTFPNAEYLISKFDFDFYSNNPNEDFLKQILPLKAVSYTHLTLPTKRIV